MKEQGDNLVVQLEKQKHWKSTLGKEIELNQRELELVKEESRLNEERLKAEGGHLLKVARDETEMWKKQLEIEMKKNIPSNQARERKKIVQLPEFDGSPLEFDSWITMVNEYFQEYNEISSFE
ncbi:hypothetical protein BB559_003316 [Furculomyces boomerangus]|uniref:Uncharacterized protein n=1 Tax=Furculomyces boomerangus TaxID=61424 RepID=A0A2T9YM16_9FUNG|nr:hypothetical protein BB559_003316 [Furculomyces boomerangus]